MILLGGMSKTFSVGDIVTWKSQAAGSWKTKTGTVVEVVPAFKAPFSEIKGFGSSRKHESYIVEVKYEPTRSTSAIKSVRVKKPKRYWPVVGNLTYVGITKVMVEDLKTSHLPVRTFPSDPDMQWKDIANSSNVESTN
jgi:hypothetical protein